MNGYLQKGRPLVNYIICINTSKTNGAGLPCCRDLAQTSPGGSIACHGIEWLRKSGNILVVNRCESFDWGSRTLSICYGTYIHVCLFNSIIVSQITDLLVKPRKRLLFHLSWVDPLTLLFLVLLYLWLLGPMISEWGQILRHANWAVARRQVVGLSRGCHFRSPILLAKYMFQCQCLYNRKLCCHFDRKCP